MSAVIETVVCFSCNGYGLYRRGVVCPTCDGCGQVLPHERHNHFMEIAMNAAPEPEESNPFDNE